MSIFHKFKGWGQVSQRTVASLCIALPHMIHRLKGLFLSYWIKSHLLLNLVSAKGNSFKTTHKLIQLKVLKAHEAPTQKRHYLT